LGQVLTVVRQKWTKDRQAIRRACRNLYRHFDREYGGFGGALEFPNSCYSFWPALEVLNRLSEVVAAVCFTLEQMPGTGSMYQLGGGFHR
jgi:uncharacterized protein YyaL (SSP411 family)